MALALGLDSSVLSSFARARRLDVFELLTSGHPRVVTRAVLEELDRGVSMYPELGRVRALPWIETVAVDSLANLIAFSDYVRILGSDGRNVGEASILAWAETTGGVVILDDNAAVNAAKSRGITVRRSLGLLCDGLHRKSLTMERARTLVDELASLGGARFPCDGAGFEVWAEKNGLLE